MIFLNLHVVRICLIVCFFFLLHAVRIFTHCPKRRTLSSPKKNNNMRNKSFYCEPFDGFRYICLEVQIVVRTQRFMVGLCTNQLQWSALIKYWGFRHCSVFREVLLRWSRCSVDSTRVVEKWVIWKEQQPLRTSINQNVAAFGKLYLGQGVLAHICGAQFKRLVNVGKLIWNIAIHSGNDRLCYRF